MEILKVENLSTGYGDFIALKSVNFIIDEGEFVGIIGPNASGKTTLLRTIAKILPVRSGNIYLLEKNITEYNYREYSKKVAFATNVSDYALNYNVYDFLMLGRYPWNFEVDGKEFKEIYENFELERIFRKKLNELSSGELQRVIVAQALIQSSCLLLLDEPVSHLDIAHQIHILDVLKKINQEKKLTILASFHELNLACEYCDKIILISNGEVRKIGTPHEVIDYRIIEEVYNTQVIVKVNPISKKPYVIPVPMMWKDN